MAKLSLAEQYTLRSLTGRIVGEVLADAYGVPSLGMVTNKTFICSSLVGAVQAAFLADRGGLGRVVTTLTEKPEEASAAVQGLEGVNTVMVAYGGEADAETNYALTKAFLKAAAEADLDADLFFHVRIWVPGFVQRALKEEPQIAEYLQERALGTFTFDLDRGVFVFHAVEVTEEGEVVSEPVLEAPLSVEHTELLRRSL
ncbi:MAG TPA: hypothetical protein ENK37_04390 [Oceanithermus profundus]|uniref:Uncharacterized protein n=1 Tax=Oceanithermus profundus TaxID=187137 RepID=A0A7C4ZGW8_9DEIN|nr:hypothetical protein [Oceanithermus profundus]